MPLNQEYLKIGSDILKAAFNVRNNSFKGMRECYYEAALVWELQQLGYHVDRQVVIPALYRGEIIDNSYLADIVVDGRVIIEVKAIKRMTEVETRQLLTYLLLSNIHLGYLINFGADNFITGKLKDGYPYDKGIYRVVNGI